MPSPNPPAIGVDRPTPGQELPEGEALSQANLENLAVREGDARVFQLAWDGGLGDVWVLVEDTIAKEAIDAARE